MFSALFRKKNSKQREVYQKAEALYSQALLQTREPVFYTEMGVPDTFDGRFDLLLLHIFILYYKYYDEEYYKTLAQNLFDITFQDMDQTLREMGIGDMGVPKHQKRMMKAFNGRMHNYMAAVAPERLDADTLSRINKGTLEDVLMRNLYGSCTEDVDKEALRKITEYITANINSPLKDDAVFVNPLKKAG
tara:strand:- start:914 stop:1483 length:570 start_codon:yes stop_codon:yes gene_type:complete